MDWRDRKYYCVSFDYYSRNMRLDILKSVGNLYNNGHGYYGKYLYYVGCNNTSCSVKPKTQSIDDIYRDSEIAIQESINRWNER